MFEEFVDGFKRLFSGVSRVLVVTHANADPDALASATIVLRLLEGIGSKGCLGVPEGLSKLSRALVDRLGVEVEFCDEGIFDGCIVVDASNPVQLGVYGDVCLRASVKALIDHHEEGLLGNLFELRLVDPRASSTTELLVHIANLMGLKLDARDATLAAAGIIFDSRRFANVSHHTFKAMSILVEWGCDYSMALKSLSVERSEIEDLSRRVAILKALARLRVERTCNDLIIAVTHIGSHESEVARTLVNLGADIAIVITERDERARISIRISGRALEKGVKASTIASYIAAKYGGEGGGHDTAAMTHIKLEDEVEKIADNIARSLPGRIARICQEHVAKKQG